MNKKKKIKQEVEKTLQCFDNAEKLEENPFFYTRVKARIDSQEKETKRNARQIAWVVLKQAFLILIVALNIYTITAFFTSKQSQVSNQDQLLNAFAQEFSLDQSSYNPNILIIE